MHKILKTGVLFFLAAIVVMVYLSAFTVKQSQAALVLRLGRLNTEQGSDRAKVYGPGLHFKWPLISESRPFDMRIQNLDVASSRILTQEQKYVLVDYYAKWRISDLSSYYKRTGGRASQARLLIQQKINALLREAFGSRTIQQVISGEREEVMNLLIQGVKQTAQGLGLEVVDVRIKRIDLPEAVTESVYERMRAQREQVATEYRSNGQAQAEKIQAKADKQVAISLANAKADSVKLRAEGDQEAADIYAKAFSKHPDFYSFYKSLETYRETLSRSGTVLVLDPKSSFFKYFQPK